MISSDINTSLFLHVNHFAQKTEWAHGLMKLIANYGILFFFLLLILGWLYSRRHDYTKLAAVVWAGIGTLVAVAINQPIVHYFHEARPYTSLQGILVLAHRSADFGFPSDHSTMAGAVTAGLFLVNPLLGFVSLAFAFVLAFSRIYIGAHYPYDVVVGLALGALVVFVGYYIVRKPLMLVTAKLATTRLRPLVTTEPDPRSE